MKAQSENEIRQRLAAVIIRHRKALAWTQQALADRCELPRTYIADIEGRRRNPSLRNLLRISNALGIALENLFTKS